MFSSKLSEEVLQLYFRIDAQCYVPIGGSSDIGARG